MCPWTDNRGNRYNAVEATSRFAVDINNGIMFPVTLWVRGCFCASACKHRLMLVLIQNNPVTCKHVLRSSGGSRIALRAVRFRQGHRRRRGVGQRSPPPKKKWKFSLNNNEHAIFCRIFTFFTNIEQIFNL